MHDIKTPADNELLTLVAYLQWHAQKPMDKTKYTDLNTPAGKSFEAICSQCHALPTQSNTQPMNGLAWSGAWHKI